jgi:hypothetical protein
MSRHYTNKKRVFTLLEDHVTKSNTKYDCIISTRLDLYFDKLYIPTPALNTLYIPEGEDQGGINDRFAMGDYESMKKYMGIYDMCYYILENKLSAQPHPEQLALANIRYHKLNIERFLLENSIIR